MTQELAAGRGEECRAAFHFFKTPAPAKLSRTLTALASRAASKLRPDTIVRDKISRMAG